MVENLKGLIYIIASALKKLHLNPLLSQPNMFTCLIVCIFPRTSQPKEEVMLFLSKDAFLNIIYGTGGVISSHPWQTKIIQFQFLETEVLQVMA